MTTGEPGRDYAVPGPVTYAFPADMYMPPRPEARAKFHATDVPRLRDDFARLADSPAFADICFYRPRGLGVRVPHDFATDRPVPIPTYATMLRNWTRIADLYYVTDEMTELARQAASNLPYYQLGRDDLPSRYGFMVFGAPAATADVAIATNQATGEEFEVHTDGANILEIRAAMWAPCQTPVGPGVQVAILSDLDLMLAHLENSPGAVKADMDRMRRAVGHLYYQDEWPAPFIVRDPDDPETLEPIPWPDPARGQHTSAWKVIVATWLLMQQHITVTTKTDLPRSVRRPYTRAGRPEPTVRTVTLRRARQAPAEHDPNQPHREYKHRWVVQGHWRNQAYGPAWSQRRLVFVPEHVKGPEGAPMIGGERVNVLRR